MEKIIDRNILITKPVRSDEEAIGKKMELLNTKLFGIFSPVTYNLMMRSKVYVPYELLVFSYEIRRGKDNQKKGLFYREGEVGIIFDMNEVHPFHFDLYDDLKLVKEKHVEGVILSGHCTFEEAEIKSKEYVQWRVLQRAFKSSGSVELIKSIKFYRPAWEMHVEARGKKMIRYAYMDEYGPENEHVSGLKVRLDI